MFEFIINTFNYLFNNHNQNQNQNNGISLFTCYHCGHNFHATFPLESDPPQDICPQCNKYVRALYRY